MNLLPVLALCLLITSPLAAARQPAALDSCLDARNIERSRILDDTTLLLAAGNGRFVLSHDQGCDSRHSSSLIGVEGWICPAADAWLHSGEQLCKVRSITRIDDRAYASLAAQADRDAVRHNADGSITLEPLQVIARAPRQRDFRGDTDYCLHPDAIRGWHLAGNDLVVQTAPRRAGGNRHYRVELTTSCPQLTWAKAIHFKSSLGLSVICGNPGDRVIPKEHENVPEDGQSMLRPPNPGLIGRQCDVAAVYPLR